MGVAVAVGCGRSRREPHLVRTSGYDPLSRCNTRPDRDPIPVARPELYNAALERLTLLLDKYDRLAAVIDQC